MTTLHLKKSMGRSPLRRGLLLIPLVLAGFALLPRAQAQTPEGVTPFEALPGFNTRDGFNALDNITTGTFNSAFGAFALEDDTSGSHNTALGGQALRNNNGNFNTAVGENALVFNQTGAQNMGLGQGALANNTTGSNNVAMGFQALNANNSSEGVAVGTQALRSNTSGRGNVAIGFQALLSSTVPGVNTFGGNVAIGYRALANTTGTAASGDSNTAVGDKALVNNITGFENTALGQNAGTAINGSGNVCIGQGVAGVAGLSSRTYIRNIFNTVSNQRAVFVNSNNQLGTLASSRRYKEEIKPMGKASETLLALKPVTFRYKKDVDPASMLSFGLIAEEVAEISPDLVTLDEEGKPETVRYEAVNAMLLNEFLKEHKKVQDLEATVSQQQKGMDVLTAQLKEQAAQIQKVSAQLEVNKVAPQTVANK